jgi:hypothetical protein
MKQASADLLKQVRQNRKQLEEASGDLSQTGFTDVEHFLEGLAVDGLASARDSQGLSSIGVNQDLASE